MRRTIGFGVDIHSAKNPEINFNFHTQMGPELGQFTTTFGSASLPVAATECTMLYMRLFLILRWLVVD